MDKLKIKKIIYEGEILPWGYGFSYYLYPQRQAVCYLFPINWIVWAFRELWYKLRDAPHGADFYHYQRGFHTGFWCGQRTADKNSYHKLVEFVKEKMNNE